MLGHLVLSGGTPRGPTIQPRVHVLDGKLLHEHFGVVRSKGPSHSERKQSEFVRFVHRVDTGRIQTPGVNRPLRP